MTEVKTRKRPVRPKLVDQDKGVEAIVAANEWSDVPRNRLRAENELAHQRLRELDSEIQAVASEVVHDAISFGQVKPGQVAPTPEMIEAYGEDVAQEKFRRMQAGCLPAKDCPVGLRVAMNIHTTAMRLRGEQAMPRLNVQVAQLNISPVSFPTLRVER